MEHAIFHVIDVLGILQTTALLVRPIKLLLNKNANVAIISSESTPHIVIVLFF